MFSAPTCCFHKDLEVIDHATLTDVFVKASRAQRCIKGFFMGGATGHQIGLATEGRRGIFIATNKRSRLWPGFVCRRTLGRGWGHSPRKRRGQRVLGGMRRGLGIDVTFARHGGHRATAAHLRPWAKASRWSYLTDSACEPVDVQPNQAVIDPCEPKANETSDFFTVPFFSSDVRCLPC
jgi:hypothetical protein